MAANLTIKNPSAKYDVTTDWSKPVKFENSQTRIRGSFLK